MWFIYDTVNFADPLTGILPTIDFVCLLQLFWFRFTGALFTEAFGAHFCKVQPCLSSVSKSRVVKDLLWGLSWLWNSLRVDWLSANWPFHRIPLTSSDSFHRVFPASIRTIFNFSQTNSVYSNVSEEGGMWEELDDWLYQDLRSGPGSPYIHGSGLTLGHASG